MTEQTRQENEYPPITLWQTIQGQTGPEFVSLLRDKLRIRAGEAMNLAGAYPSRLGIRRAVSDDNLRAHLLGEDSEQCWAFCVTYRGKANFLAFDVDEDAEIRIPVIAAVLKKRGLDAAAFITSGSSLGKGKVVITLARPMPQRAAHDMLLRILQDARTLKPDLFPLIDAKIDLRPIRSGQSLLRIGGRHRTKGSQVDCFLDLDWLPLNPESIRPARITKVAGSDPVAVTGKPEPLAFVSRLLGGLKESESYESLRRKLIRLAHEAIRLKGDGELGRAKHQEWFHTILSASPGLETKLARAMKNSFDNAIASRRKQEAELDITTLVPLPLRERSNASMLRVIQVMLDYCDKQGLNPTGFTIGQQQIAYFLGKGQPYVSRLINKAITLGILVRPFEGTPGPYGLAAMYAIVKPGQDASAVQAESKRTHLYAEQSAKAAKRTRTSYSNQVCQAQSAAV